MIRRPPRSTLDRSSAASDVYKRQTLNRIGAIYNSQGKYADAMEIYEEALAIAREFGDKTGESMMLFNIGEVHKDQGLSLIHISEPTRPY